MSKRKCVIMSHGIELEVILCYVSWFHVILLLLFCCSEIIHWFVAQVSSFFVDAYLDYIPLSFSLYVYIVTVLFDALFVMTCIYSMIKLSCNSITTCFIFCKKNLNKHKFNIPNNMMSSFLATLKLYYFWIAIELIIMCLWTTNNQLAPITIGLLFLAWL